MFFQAGLSRKKFIELAFDINQVMGNYRMTGLERRPR